MSRRIEGVGISLRPEHHGAILATERRVDWLEIQPENYMRQGPRAQWALDACSERWPLIAHGIALSLGSPDPLSSDYLGDLARVLERIDAPYFSEHASFASAGGMSFHELLPLPFSERMADHLAARIREARDAIALPLSVENITYYAVMPSSAMSEGAFLTRVLDEADAGLLLDLNNVYVNAINHGQSPERVLHDLPLARTKQIHLAGHCREGDLLIDDHGSAVPEPVWELYRAALERLGPIPTLIEWENNLPSVDRVLDEADKARALLEAARVRWSISAGVFE